MHENYVKPIFDTSEILSLADTHKFLTNYKDNICCLDFNNYKKILKKKLKNLCSGPVISFPIKEILKKFQYACTDTSDNGIVDSQTIDNNLTETSISQLSFCGNNVSQVKYESRLFKMLEENYFYLLYECKNEPKFNEEHSGGITVADYISKKIKNETVLYLNDFNDKHKKAVSTSLDEVNEIHDYFDNGVVYFKNKPKDNRRYIIKQLFSFFNKIKDDGEIFITNESAKILPYSNKAYEILLKLSGFKISDFGQPGKSLFARRL